MGYLDFLDLVLSEELAVRDDRRFRQGLRLSKLPRHKTLDEYDFSFQPDLDPRKVKGPRHPLVRRGQGERRSARAAGGRQDTHRARAVAACRAGYSIYREQSARPARRIPGGGRASSSVAVRAAQLMRPHAQWFGTTALLRVTGESSTSQPPPCSTRQQPQY